MAWSEIRYYESKESLRKLCSSKLGYTPNSNRCEQIISCFHMARDYYVSATNSNITIAPLLFYYGMANLAKAITLIFGGKRYCSLDMLGESHGLGMMKSENRKSSIEEYACQITNSGVFVSLLNTFSYDFKFSFFGKDCLCLKVANSQSLGGVQLKLRDMLLNIPDLRGLCVKTFDQLPRAVDVLVRPERDMMDPSYGKAKRTLTFYNTNLSDLSISNDKPAAWDRVSQEDDDIWMISKNIPERFCIWSEVRRFDDDPFSPSVSARIYLDAVSQPLLSAWISEYICMYIMGMIVRYHPDLWVAIISRKQDSQMLAILEQFIDFSKENFPSYILSLLDYPCIINEKHILPLKNLPRGMKLIDQ